MRVRRRLRRHLLDVGRPSADGIQAARTAFAASCRSVLHWIKKPVLAERCLGIMWASGGCGFDHHGGGPHIEEPVDVEGGARIKVRVTCTNPAPGRRSPLLPGVPHPGPRPREEPTPSTTLPSRLLPSEAPLSSEPVRINPPTQPPSTLPSELNQEQTELLLEIAAPYTEAGVWPVWDFVVKRMDKRKLNARDVLASLPRVGTTGTLGPSYGFTVGHDWRMIRDEEPVQLTIAAALPLGELRSVLADPFLRVLHHMITLQRDEEPSPTAVTETWLESQELARAMPDLKPEFIALLPQILRGEPHPGRRCDAPTDRCAAQPHRHARHARPGSPEPFARRTSQASTKRPRCSPSQQVTLTDTGVNSRGRCDTGDQRTVQFEATA